jgi:putative ABC transport system permease protein
LIEFKKGIAAAMSQIVGFDRPTPMPNAMRRRLRVSAYLAWRILVHEKGRTALAFAGVFIAILLVFIELGFFIAVPQGGMLVYDHMRFDLLLCSKDYVFQAEPNQFPRARLAQAAAVDGVAKAMPLYFGGGKWRDPGGGVRLDVFAIAFDSADNPFAVSSIEGQRAVMERPDAMLVDDSTRPPFGPLTTGRAVEINGRRMTIGGEYTLGTGFLGIGVVMMDETNFQRAFPGRRLDPVNLGLIVLSPGVDPEQVEAELRKALPDDVQLFTRGQLQTHEDAYWTTRTSVGLIFGSGLIVSLIVGIMVLYQTLATQITRHLPQFATLKAIGYADSYLGTVVVFEAMLVVVAAFVPATLAAMAVYALIRGETLLPVALTASRFAAVLALALIMSVASALLSLGYLRRADPADVF